VLWQGQWSNSVEQLRALRAKHMQRRPPVLPGGAQKQKVLATLGRDDASAGSASLKLWGLDGVRPGGAPACQRTLRCFAPAGKAAEAAVTAAALHADAWPHLALALGLADGAVLLLRGEAGAQAGCLRSPSVQETAVCGPWKAPHKRTCHAETWNSGAAVLPYLSTSLVCAVCTATGTGSCWSAQAGTRCSASCWAAEERVAGRARSLAWASEARVGSWLCSAVHVWRCNVGGRGALLQSCHPMCMQPRCWSLLRKSSMQAVLGVHAPSHV